METERWKSWDIMIKPWIIKKKHTYIIRHLRLGLGNMTVVWPLSGVLKRRYACWPSSAHTVEQYLCSSGSLSPLNSGLHCFAPEQRKSLNTLTTRGRVTEMLSTNSLDPLTHLNPSIPLTAGLNLRSSLLVGLQLRELLWWHWAETVSVFIFVQ